MLWTDRPWHRAAKFYPELMSRTDEPTLTNTGVVQNQQLFEALSPLSTNDRPP